MGDHTKDRFGYEGVMGNNSAGRKLLEKNQNSFANY
jgi:hypothetical protein